MLYLIQVICYTGLLSLIYILLLRNKPFHTFNRAYLLLAAITPLVLPFIKVPGMENQLQTATITGIQLPELIVGQEQQQIVATGVSMFWALYIGVSISIAIVAMWRWYCLNKFISRQTTQQKDDYVLLTNTGYGPGSWHKYIILPDESINETVIGHELAHIRLHHTRDVVLFTILQVFFWPNIFLVWLKKELTQVHEFQADAAIDADEKAYAELLLSNLFQTCSLPQTHSFIIHPIKRRIMMLKKQSSNARRLATFSLTAFAVGFLMANIVVLQSCKRKAWEVKSTEEDKAYTGWWKNEKGVLISPGDTLKFADKMPEFPGGSDSLYSYMARSIVYPQEARKKQLEGRVVVSFVVAADGNITRVQVAKSSNEIFTKPALEVINNMPKWIPGENDGHKVSVIYHLPISFKLS